MNWWSSPPRLSGKVSRVSDGVFYWNLAGIPPHFEWVRSPRFRFGECLWHLELFLTLLSGRRLYLQALLVREMSADDLGPYEIEVAHALGWRKVNGAVVEADPVQIFFRKGSQNHPSSSILNDVEGSDERYSDQFRATKTITCRFIGGEQTEPLPKQIEGESDALRKQLVEAQSTICKLKGDNDTLSKKLSETEAENSSYKEENDAMRKKLRVFESSESSLSSDFRHLLSSGEKSDIVLKVQGREFRAHRVVLAARSPVFRATFCHDSEEERTGVVQIPDCDPESFPYLLQFLYCGKVDEMTFEAALGLYQSADKYDVQALKSSCSDLLRRNLTPESICDVALLADLHSDYELASAAQLYFNENYIDVLQTPAWTDWMKKNPRVTAKLLKEMAAAAKK